MINLLIADDHSLFIDGIVNAIKPEEDITVKALAHNGVEVLEFIKQELVDIILLDISMPIMNGIECAKKLKVGYPTVKVIILSQFYDDKLIKRVSKYNIKGYLVKSADKSEILESIRTVFRGGKFFSSEINNEARNELTGYSKFKTLKSPFSKRENQVLELICDGKKNEEIADILKLSVHTIETFRARLMMKAGMRNTAELVKWAYENDLI